MPNTCNLVSYVCNHYLVLDSALISQNIRLRYCKRLQDLDKVCIKIPKLGVDATRTLPIWADKIIISAYSIGRGMLCSYLWSLQVGQKPPGEALESSCSRKFQKVGWILPPGIFLTTNQPCQGFCARQNCILQSCQFPSLQATRKKKQLQ